MLSTVLLDKGVEGVVIMSVSNTTVLYLTRVCVSPLMHQDFSRAGAGNRACNGALSVFVILASQSPP